MFFFLNGYHIFCYQMYHSKEFTKVWRPKDCNFLPLNNRSIISWHMLRYNLPECLSHHIPNEECANYRNVKCHRCTLCSLIFILSFFVPEIHGDISCTYSGSKDLHPFAFRVHTHSLGKDLYLTNFQSFAGYFIVFSKFAQSYFSIIDHWRIVVSIPNNGKEYTGKRNWILLMLSLPKLRNNLENMYDAMTFNFLHRKMKSYISWCPVMPTESHFSGRVVSAYHNNGTWSQIGKGNPQWPQAFYKMDQKMIIKPGEPMVC